MTAPGTNASRTMWTLIFAGMANAVVLYGILLAILRTPTHPASPAAQGALRAIFYVVAAAMLIASVVWIRLRGSPTVDGRLRTPAEFQVASLAGLALAEGAGVVGFLHGILGAPLVEYLPFGIASLTVLLAFHLPAGLAYWREWEEAERRGPGPRPLG